MRICELLVSDGCRELVKATEMSPMSLLQWMDVSALPQFRQGAVI